MTRLPPDQLMTTLRTEGDALAAAASSDLDASVATCPGWTVADCVEHTGSVHRWVEHIVRTGQQVRRRDMAGPDGDLLAWYREGLGLLVIALTALEPDTEVWSFAVHSPSTVRWWMRRQAQETAMHRWDVEAVTTGAGRAVPFEAEFAADGIDEYVADFLPEAEDLVGLGGTLHLHATDTDGEWFVDLADPGAPPRHEHGKADTALRGPASDLLLWAWNRLPPDRLEVFGDRSVVERWTQVRM
ncbi:MAG: maleylpyruvate isomerase family mycothiol-dependent enzyme [Acidimicrobiales bacterium]